jgi:hypothetical protein
LPYALASFVLRAVFTHGRPPCEHLRADAAASTTSHPAFVTIAIRPFCRERTGELVALICPTGPAKYFFRGDWTTQITLKSLRKLNFTRSGFFGLSSSSDTECRLICLVGQISSSRVLCGHEPPLPLHHCFCGNEAAAWTHNAQINPNSSELTKARSLAAGLSPCATA